MKNSIKNELMGIAFLGIGIFISWVLYRGFLNDSNNVELNEVGQLGRGLYQIIFILFGKLSYVLPVIFVTYGVVFLFDKQFKINRFKVLGMIIFLMLIASLIVILDFDTNQHKVNQLKLIFNLGWEDKSSGGIIGALIVIPLFWLLGKGGAIIAILTLLIINISLLANRVIKDMFKRIAEYIKLQKLKSLTKVEKEKVEGEKPKRVLNFNKNKDKEKKVENKLENLKKENIDISKDEKKTLDGKIKEEDREKKSKINQENNESQIDKKDVEINSKNLEQKKIDLNGNKTIDDLFEERKENPAKKEEINKKIQNKILDLEEVLLEYGIDAKVVNYVIGPVITRFELSVSRGVRVKKIVALSDDIAMNLEAESIRIEAPIPGKNAVGIEIPNEIIEPVYFSSILKSKKMKKEKTPTTIILGKNIIGEDTIIDLAKMPHLLIAGRTGSGKSVCINTLISSIISNFSEKDIRFIMVDPKMVELMPYNGIPHLLVPVIIEPKKAAIALKWAVNEMESRYKLLAEKGVRNLESYNKLQGIEKLPVIIIVIDELADLMMVAPASIEESVARIAQKARAIAIHLVIATQRPTTDVITGTIKANLPSRISFAVASQIDSRTILDTPGAEKLLGKGDMLFSESGKPNLVRIQGAYISDEEVVKLTTYVKNKGKPVYNSEIIKETDEEEKDELYDKVIEMIQTEGKISISLIQRKLKVGYSRAARIYDSLLANGIVNNEREILI